MKNRLSQLLLWGRALLIYEKRLLVKVARARNAYIKTAAEQYAKSNGVPNWLLDAYREKLNTILNDHYETVITHFGQMVIRQIKSIKIETKAARRTFTGAMLEWVRTEALRKATMISGTDSDLIRNAIQNGIDEGEGIEAIGRSIRKVSAMTTARAAVIARTETHNAAGFGSIETARNAETEFGVQLLKVWLPTLDARTREDHRAMENKDPIPLGEKFQVGADNMDRPGDPSANPENVINCRCAIAYEEK